MPLRAISRVIAIFGRTTETTESIATVGGWFMVKYFAICVPWALAWASDECAESRFCSQAWVLLTAISNRRRPVTLLRVEEYHLFGKFLEEPTKDSEFFGRNRQIQCFSTN
jgi:hypothetical protein